MKKIISLIISLLILTIIYWKIDFASLLELFKSSNIFWMLISLGMFIPLTIITSWRFQQLMPKGDKISFIEANKLILVASVLNMILPSKMGDIAKAYFMTQKGHLEGTLSLSLVIFEKSCDFLSLLLWCVFGLGFFPPQEKPFWLGIMTAIIMTGIVIFSLLLGSKKFAKLFFNLVKNIKIIPQKITSKLSKLEESWQIMHNYFWSDKKLLLLIAITSIFLWFLHLLQIWLFIFALNAYVPFLTNLALSSLAILAGLLPLTFGGVGTRDAALILLYKPYLTVITAAGLGLLCTSRYLLPALAGLPFLNQYLYILPKITKDN